MLIQYSTAVFYILSTLIKLAMFENPGFIVRIKTLSLVVPMLAPDVRERPPPLDLIGQAVPRRTISCVLCQLTPWIPSQQLHLRRSHEEQ